MGFARSIPLLPLAALGLAGCASTRTTSTPTLRSRSVPGSKLSKGLIWQTSFICGAVSCCAIAETSSRMKRSPPPPLGCGLRTQTERRSLLTTSARTPSGACSAAGAMEAISVE